MTQMHLSLLVRANLVPQIVDSTNLPSAETVSKNSENTVTWAQIDELLHYDPMLARLVRVLVVLLNQSSIVVLRSFL